MATVLVVEDQPISMKLAVSLLQSAGHTVLTASTGEAALPIARQEQPDLILMDIQLPGMDGLEATRLLKGDTATCAIPVIALTALAMKGDEERIRAAGCNGYIAKPLAYRDFLAIIDVQLAGSPLKASEPGASLKPAPVIASQPSRILIVDDDRLNRQLLEVMLASEGFRLLTADSGEEALAMVLQAPPDLVLVDILLPGMDGYALTARIKANLATRNIPVIIVTDLSDHDARMLGLSAGAEDFLSRPLDRAELCVRVRNLLRLKAYGDYYDRYSQMLEGEVGWRTADLVDRTKTLEEQTAVLGEQAALLDLAQDAIVVRDVYGRIVFWSRGAEIMYGWQSDEVLGRNASALLKAQSAEPAGDAETTLLRLGQWEGEAIHHKRDGTRVFVASRWALQRDAAGTPIRVLTINSDISRRTRTDSEIRLLTAHLALATAVAKVGVWEWDPATDTLTWDAAMFEIYGCPATGPMAYDQWSATVWPDDLPAVEAMRRRAIAERGQGSAEHRILRPDGSVRYVSTVGRAVVDERDNVTRVIGVDMDVTERRRAESAVEEIREDHLRFKGDFLSHVSQELRSPLTAITQLTTGLLSDLPGEPDDEQREQQQGVLKHIQQLQSTIDRLFEATRLEIGKLAARPGSVAAAGAATGPFSVPASSKQAAVRRDPAAAPARSLRRPGSSPADIHNAPRQRPQASARRRHRDN